MTTKTIAALTGYGQSGYVAFQLESEYGVAATDSMVYLPAVREANMEIDKKPDELDQGLANFLSNKPLQGRVSIMSNGFKTEVFPSLIAPLLKAFLGLNNAAALSDTSVYNQVFITPNNVSKCGGSMTIDIAIGSDLATRYTGCKITGIKFEGGTEKAITCDISMVAQAYEHGITRITSFSRPTERVFQSYDAHVFLKFNTYSEFQEQLVDKWEFDMKLDYQEDYYKSGSRYIQEPIFKGDDKAEGIVKVNGAIDIDATQTYQLSALAYETFDLKVEITSSEYIHGTQPFYLKLFSYECLWDTNTRPQPKDGLIKMSCKWRAHGKSVTVNSVAKNIKAQINATSLSNS